MNGFVVRFKSDPENYRKEKTDLKNNTVRLVDRDPRFKMLAKLASVGGYGYIEITENGTNSSFVRVISDVTYIDKYVIITWFPMFAPPLSRADMVVRPDLPGSSGKRATDQEQWGEL